MADIALLLPDMRPGGAERVSANLANGLVRRGHRVDLLLASATGELLGELHPGVRVLDLHAPRLRSVLLPLVRYLRRERPAALLACMWPLTVIALWARRLARVHTRVVVAEHATWSHSEILTNQFIDWQVRRSMHHFFPGADGIVTVSHGAADDLARFAHLPRPSITVIYNPVVDEAAPMPDMAGATAPEGWCHGPHCKVLAVGSLKEIKEYPKLVEAFALLRRRLNARLLILGDGTCRAALEAQVRRLDLGGQVFLPGFVKNPAPYYRRADLHVLSSYSEALPTVLIEALASGTPVVSTDCPSGPREILDGGRFGRLVPVGDVPALASAMAEALARPADAAVLRARALDFSIDKAVARYEALLLPQALTMKAA